MSFQRIRFLLRSVLLPALAAASIAAHAGPFTGIFIFGDSLSDTGNVSIATGGAAPDPTQPYAPGRFSDGPLWVETFAAGLGLAAQATPALAGGNNYAFAGARTGFSGAGEPLGVLSQVVGLWGQGTPVDPSRADPNALYVVVAGGNDMRDARTLYPSNSPADIAGRAAMAAAAFNNLAATIGYLAASGARNVLISTLPDLGATPEAMFLNLQAASTDATNFFNGLVPTLLSLYAGLNIELLDMAAIAANVYANPQDFGVTNVSFPCGSFDFSQGESCATSLFSDALHPSAYAHLLIGQAALAIYGVPVPGTLALMALALLLMVGIQRSRAGRSRVMVAVLRPAAR
ncbi:SGNH/GDSL hydrolase family protein [Hydrogenophaga sp.]|uniref:SGNH/GDSL hydrolase family protein n=2 Tax=Hydrogenophaga sp. TaxID=1904254 RepID=UPI0027330584|nr:SGNH/GDSL hydrolase family protein [Hydrogenophaga sp.]MDP3347461.1 SGNH/GDSL hydrolase family protein [Hydrogenophaga sp.]MDZ4398243.1 SGNH/GDSL hydrolase family protein [Hydrogenophaga sp.]